MKLLTRSPYTVTELSDHGVSMLVDIRDPAISKPILVLGEYESGVTRQLLSFVRDDTHFVDVGANIGYFTLLVAGHTSKGAVWSFEPDTQNYQLLAANVALNGFSGRIRTYHAAVSDKSGNIFFSNLGFDRNIGARFTAKNPETLKERSLPGTPPPQKVQAIVLDELLAGEKIDLVKIDVEGAEPGVFAGMKHILHKQRPVIVTEFAPGTIQHISKSDPVDLLRFLREVHYTFAVIQSNGSTGATETDPEVILGSLNESHHHLDLLLRPESC